MAESILMNNGAGGSGGSDEATAARANVMATDKNGRVLTAIASDTGDEALQGLLPADHVLAKGPNDPIDYGGSMNRSKVHPDAGGDMPINTDSGNQRLSVNKTSHSYSPGYYANSHGADVELQEKTVNSSTSAQDVTPDNNKLLKKVHVNAMATGSAKTPVTTITTAAPGMSSAISGTNLVITSAAVSKTQSITPTVTAGYVSSGTAGNVTASSPAATLSIPVYQGSVSNW